jgi:hypothetical protein
MARIIQFVFILIGHKKSAAFFTCIAMVDVSQVFPWRQDGKR